MSLIDGLIYLFGGMNEKGTALNDLWFFDPGMSVFPFPLRS